MLNERQSTPDLDSRSCMSKDTFPLPFQRLPTLRHTQPLKTITA